MIKFSVTIMRGCFGGCSFCSITEHEGRDHPEPLARSRSSREIERIRDQTPGFTGIISDLGGPTANMYRLACKSREIEAACRKPSCVFPDICDNLGTDHAPLVALYRKARALPGVKRMLHRVGRSLRPRGALARVDPRARAAPHRRLSQDRARAHRGRPAPAHDEAGHRRLRSLQGAVRSLLARRRARSST